LKKKKISSRLEMKLKKNKQIITNINIIIWPL
jgi:hypothetical protein